MARAIRGESALGNKSECPTDLYAYQIRETGALCPTDCESTVSPSQCVHLQFRRILDLGVVRTIWSGDLDALKGILETYTLAVGNPARGESM